MREVFDTYKKKTKLYYILTTVTVVTIGFVITAKIMNIQIPQRYSILTEILFAIGLATTVVTMFITGTNFVKMYKKDGEITISSDLITINLLKIPVNEIQKIEIRCNDYRGARSSDGSGNWMQIFDNSNKSYFIRFVIGSKDQKNKLKVILEELESKGVSIIS